MASGTEEVTCYSFKFSPYAHRVEIALKEKDIPHKTIVVEDLSNKPKGLLDANPVWKTVPTITHRGDSVAESLIILEYLEEAFPGKVPLMPTEAIDKAKVRFWADYIEKGLDSIKAAMMASGSSSPKPDPEGLRKFFKTLNDTMMGYSGDGPFFAGDKLGFLDVFLGPIVLLFQVTEICWAPIPGPEEIPRFHKWAETMKARKSVRDVLPSNQQFVDYFFELARKMAAKAGAPSK